MNKTVYRISVLHADVLSTYHEEALTSAYKIYKGMMSKGRKVWLEKLELYDQGVRISVIEKSWEGEKKCI